MDIYLHFRNYRNKIIYSGLSFSQEKMSKVFFSEKYYLEST